MNDLTIPLERDTKDPLYLQIYNYIKNEIQKGSLPVGEKLPSTRALAEYLHIARSTVDFAYGQLLSEGYIESIPYKGHFVCEISGVYRQLESVSSEETETFSDEVKYDFSPNRIAIDSFPFDTWRRISKKVFLDEEKEVFSMGDAKGDFRLRKAICDYLHSSRGVICNPSQIIVGAGNDYLLMLLQKILGVNQCVAVENPAYMRATRIFQSGGYQVEPIDLDENGLRADLLEKSNADIAYVTPSRQFPTGIVMPIGRRNELFAWAEKSEERYIIEDDYDSEFRYKGLPIPSLQASDQNGKVIYLGTFSKSITPAIRLSYMVLPKKLIKNYEEKLWFISSTVSRIDQAVLYHFMEEGHFERYLNKMRKIYKGKHDLLLECLKPFCKKFEISGEHGGLHVILKAKKGDVTAEDLQSAALSYDCRVYSMRDYCLKEKSKEQVQLILGYASMSERQIVEGVEALKRAWGIE